MSPNDPPFKAYTGDKPFAFVSYAHADASAVYPELKRLSALRMRIWYDEGIDPGNEWPDEIAAKIKRCSLFFVFFSARAVDSKNVKNEVRFALGKDRQLIAVHIEQTELPDGLELQIGSNQAVHKWNMPDAPYLRKLQQILDNHTSVLAASNETPNPEFSTDSPTEEERGSNVVIKPKASAGWLNRTLRSLLPRRRPVYISYSRKDGASVARAVTEALKGRGFQVVLDVDSMSTGSPFSAQIEEMIKSSAYFILILTDGLLRQIHRPDSWIAKEIEFAMRSNRIILPIFVGDIPWSEAFAGLPTNLAAIRNFQGFRYDEFHFNSFVDHVVRAL